MSLITVLASRIDDECRRNCYSHLLIQKALIDKHFPWISCKIQENVLLGQGFVKVAGLSYNVEILYSPFCDYRFDRILIKNPIIPYHRDIHLYSDLSLCLYHPQFDRPLFCGVSLFRMIPWISEWCVFYNEWKKYGIWLGKEIKH